MRREDREINNIEEIVAIIEKCDVCRIALFDEEYPIALLILFHQAQELKEDNWHWVTITGYVEDEDNTKRSQIILSNCGERQIVNTDILFKVSPKNIVRMVAFKNERKII